MPRPDREGLRAIRDRWQRTLLLAGAIGVVTGAGVALFEWVTARVLLAHVMELPRAAIAILPAAGLLAAWVLLRSVARASPSTSDEYIRNYHERGVSLDLRPVLGRMLASVATLGTGGALGFEGPSIYLGAAVGTATARRSSMADPTKILMVAGAAAGIAAIFKTPATGVLFALEVPYREDIAADAVLPTVIAAATSYLVFVAFNGTTALFPVAGNPSFNVRDLLGAAGLGLLAGAGAHVFAVAIRACKHASGRIPGPLRWLVGGIGLATLAAVTFRVYGSPLALGPGYSVVAWLTDPGRSLGLIALLFAVRFLAASATVAGGGAGGLFIPLVVLGALLGRAFGVVIGIPTTLFAVVGAAAFLGAGYRTPLAAVVFVAESTGRPGFIVPGLIATAIAQLMMGETSVSEYLIRARPAPG